MNLPNFAAYIESLKSDLITRSVPASIAVEHDRITELSYAFLDNNLNEYWDYCAGPNAVLENFAVNQKYINDTFQKYLHKLIELTSKRNNLAAKTSTAHKLLEIDREIAAHYYFLYKIESMIQAVDGAMASPHLTAAQKDEQFWDQQAWKVKTNFNDCFGGSRTIHAVQVLDGSGDLIHFTNWFKEYCSRCNVSNTTVIIVLGPKSNEKDVRKYLANLDDLHPLNNHPDLTISKGALDLVLYGAMFAPILNGEAANFYRALYAISTPLFFTFKDFLRIPHIGLTTCLINEMGIEIRRKENPPRNFYEFSFGIGIDPRTKPIGFLFPKVKPVEKLEAIIARLSDNMKIKLFGQSSLEWTLEQLLTKAKNVKIVSAYYSNGRDLAPLNNLLRNIGSNTIVFFTGIDQLPPADFYPEIPTSTKDRRVVCGDLSRGDYNDLMQLIRTDSKHWFVCSGDNTFAQSIAIGKIPVFLHRKPENRDKKTAIDNFLLIIETISTRMSPAKKALTKEIVAYIRYPYTSKQPSTEALKFFEECISPYIRTNFELSKNVAELIINVENDFQEEFNPLIEPWDKSKDESVKRTFTPMFEIRHFESKQTKVDNIAPQAHKPFDI